MTGKVSWHICATSCPYAIGIIVAFLLCSIVFAFADTVLCEFDFKLLHHKAPVVVNSTVQNF